MTRSNQVHIAIVSHQGGKAGGAEHGLLQLVERLPGNVRVSWFFFEDGEHAQEIRRRFESVTIIKMSNRVAQVARASLPVSAVIDSLRVVWHLALELTRMRPDVVLTNSMKAHVVGSLASKLAGLRCVNFVQDIVDGRALGLLRFVSRLCAVERLACANIVKQHLRLPRTTVVYVAVETDQFAELPDRGAARRSLGLPEFETPIIGLVGRIARWKGQDRFVRIADMVLAQEDAHFCIIGSPLFGCDKEYVDDLHAEVERRGIGNRFTFVPWQENMQAVYAAIDVACNCSDREPFGRTSQEALASGVPIVCFDDAGICEIFGQGQGGFKVPAGDEDAFAAAILVYLKSRDQLAVARKDARIVAQQTDIRHTYAAFSGAIGRVADRELPMLSEEQAR